MEGGVHNRPPGRARSRPTSEGFAIEHGDEISVAPWVGCCGGGNAGTKKHNGSDQEVEVDHPEESVAV